MKKRRFIALFMALMMVITLLPSEMLMTRAYGDTYACHIYEVYTDGSHGTSEGKSTLQDALSVVNKSENQNKHFYITLDQDIQEYGLAVLQNYGSTTIDLNGHAWVGQEKADSTQNLISYVSDLIITDTSTVKPEHRVYVSGYGVNDLEFLFENEWNKNNNNNFTKYTLESFKGIANKVSSMSSSVVVQIYGGLITGNFQKASAFDGDSYGYLSADGQLWIKNITLFANHTTLVDSRYPTSITSTDPGVYIENCDIVFNFDSSNYVNSLIYSKNGVSISDSEFSYNKFSSKGTRILETGRDLSLNNVTINNNTILSSFKGAVTFNTTASLSGKVVISDNKSGTSAGNLYLPTGNERINVQTAFDETSRVGIYSVNTGTIGSYPTSLFTGNSHVTDSLFSDTTDKMIYLDGTGNLMATAGYHVNNTLPESDKSKNQGYLEVTEWVAPGQTVTITPHPFSNCAYTKVFYTVGDSIENAVKHELTANGEGKYTFSMPSEGGNVTIGAELTLPYISWQAGDAVYTSFSDALIASNSNETIILLKSDDVQDIVIPANAQATVDLNGLTLIGTGTGSVITNHGTLKLASGASKGLGVVTGGNAALGGGIYNDGVLTLEGVNITGNTASQNGGGVYDNGSLTLCGVTKIDNNTLSGSGKANNLFLKSGKTVSFDNTSKPAEGTSIGVTLENLPEGNSFTAVAEANAVNYKAYFHSDDPSVGSIVSEYRDNKYTLKYDRLEAVSYEAAVLGRYGNTLGYTTKSADDYTLLYQYQDSIPTTWGAEGQDSWYVVMGNITLSEVTVLGHVNLILYDGCNLSVTAATADKAGILVTGDNSLSIYGQAAQTGILTAQGNVNGAGIGSGKNQNCGEISIEGGNITSIGGENAAGIGSSGSGAVDGIIIRGGKVTARGGANAVGIGGGYLSENSGNAENIQISGGVVEAYGGTGAPGIGASGNGYAENIFINSGSVKAEAGSDNISAIGSAANMSACSVYVDSSLRIFAGNSSDPATLLTIADRTENTNLANEAGFCVRYINIGAAKQDTYFDPVIEKNRYRYDAIQVVSGTAEALFGTAGQNSWYVVSGDSQQILLSGGVKISGNVNLILEDGSSLKITGGNGRSGIQIMDGASLTVYAQEEGNGSLSVEGGSNSSAVTVGTGSRMTINGGLIEAIGKDNKGSITGSGEYQVYVNSSLVVAAGTSKESLRQIAEGRENSTDISSLVSESVQLYTAKRTDILSFSSDASFTVKVPSSDAYTGSLLYSTNKVFWYDVEKGNPIQAGAEGTNYVLYFRGTENTVITGNGNGVEWAVTAAEGHLVRVGGKIGALLDYSNADTVQMGAYAFASMFKNCTCLAGVPEFTAAAAENCYASMFEGCTNVKITDAPSDNSVYIVRKFSSLTGTQNMFGTYKLQKNKAYYFPVPDDKVTISASEYGKVSIVIDGDSAYLIITEGDEATCVSVGFKNTATEEDITASVNYDSASGYFELPDYPFTVTAGFEPYVCIIGSESYDSLASAVSAANNGDVIKLCRDIKEAVSIPEGKNVTIDLNGHICSQKGITNAGTLSLIDTKKDALKYFFYDEDGVWTLISSPTQEQTDKADSLDQINAETEIVIVYGGAITGVTTGHSIENAGSLTMTGINVIGNSCSMLLSKTSGSVILDNCNICGNTSVSNGAVDSKKDSGLILRNDTMILYNSLTEGQKANLFLMGALSADESSFTGKAGITLDESLFSNGYVLFVEQGKSGSSSSFVSDVADYFVCEDNGKYYLSNVVAATAAGSYYPSINIAVNNAEYGSIIKLMRDQKENIVIPEGKTVTLDLNGHILRPQDASSVVIENNGRLTITDLNKETVSFVKVSADGSEWEVLENPTGEQKTAAVSIEEFDWYSEEMPEFFSVKGGAITGAHVTGSDKYGAAVFCGNDATLTLQSVNIIGNYGQNGGSAVYMSSKRGDTKLAVRSSYICGNYTAAAGGAVFSEGVDVSLLNSVLGANTAKTNGGAIYAYKCGVILNDTVVRNNLVTDNSGRGAGVYIKATDTEEHVELGGFTVVTGNTANDKNGYPVDSNIFMDGYETISFNTAKKFTGEAGVFRGTLLNTGSALFECSGTLENAAAIFTDDPLYVVYLKNGTTAVLESCADAGISSVLNLSSLENFSTYQGYVRFVIIKNSDGMKICGWTYNSINGNDSEGDYQFRNVILGDEVTEALIDPAEDGHTFELCELPESDSTLYGFFEHQNHSFTYSVKENDPATIIAQCSDSKCTEKNLELTILAPTMERYAQTDVNAEASFSSDEFAAMDELPEIFYQKKDTNSGEYGSSSADAPTLPGSYRAGFTVGGVSAYVSYTIIDGTPEVDIPEAKALTYSSAAQELINAVVCEKGTVEYAIGTSASSAPEEGWSTSIPKGTDAGTYYVWYRVKATADYYGDGAPACITAEIDKLDISDLLTMDAIQDQTYDRNNKTPSVTVRMQGEVFSSSEYSVSYSNNKKAGTGTAQATVTIDKSKNYCGEVSRTFTILKRKLKIYDHGNQGYTISCDYGTKLSEIPVIVYEYGKTDSTYNIFLPQWDGDTSKYVDGTYEWVEPENIPSVETKKAQVRFVPNEDEEDCYEELLVYININVSPIKAQYTIPEISAAEGQKLEEIWLPEGFSWIDESVVITDSNATGKYLRYTPQSSNYTTDDIEITIDVIDSKDSQNLSLLVDGTEVTLAAVSGKAGMYTAAAKKITLADGMTISVNDAKTPVYFYSSNTSVVSVNKETGEVSLNGAGKADISIWAIDSASYKAEKITFALEVVKATPVVEDDSYPTAESITIGQSLSDSTLSGGKAVYKETEVAGHFEWAEDCKPKDTKGYKVYFIPDDTDTYNKITLYVKVTVELKKVTINEFSVGSALVYGQKLSESGLSGTASVDGTFEWVDGDAKPDATGEDGALFEAKFVPDDADYETVDLQVSVVVNKAQAAINVSVSSELVYDASSHELISLTGFTGDSIEFALGENDADLPEDGWSINIPEKTDAGTYYVWCRVEAPENNYISCNPDCATVTIAKRSSENIVITLEDEEYTYTGEAIEPAVLSINDYYNGTENTDYREIASSDYEVEYSNNLIVPQGEELPTVTVTLKNYQTPVSKTFTIEKAAPSYDEPKGKYSPMYSGKAQELIDAGTTSHGTFVYLLAEDEKEEPAAGGEDWSEEIPTGIDAGTYYVWYMIKGDDNHLDTEPQKISHEIHPYNTGEYQSKITYSYLPAVPYSGKAYTPELQIHFGDILLIPGQDYTLSYEDNIEPGIATVSVAFKGNYAYTQVVKFRITGGLPEIVTKPTAAAPWVYDGTEHSLVKAGSVVNGKFVYTVDYEDTDTPAATDAGYYEISYSVQGAAGYENIDDAGSFCVQVLPKTEGITVSVSDTEYKANDGDTDREYKPAVTVKDGEKTLTQDTDYTVAYTNNTNSAIAANSTPSVTVTLKGNYYGTLTSAFNVTGGTPQARSIPYSGSAEALVVPGAAPDGSHYEYALGENETSAPDKGWSTGLPTSKDIKTYYVWYKMSGDEESAPACLTSEIRKRKAAEGISIAAIPDQVYTGSELTPEPSVYCNGKKLTEGSDYSVTYQNNIDSYYVSDKYSTVTVTLKGNFEGTLTEEFSIACAPVECSISAKDLVYTGKPQALIEFVSDQNLFVQYRVIPFDYQITGDIQRFRDLYPEEYSKYTETYGYCYTLPTGTNAHDYYVEVMAGVLDENGDIDLNFDEYYSQTIRVTIAPKPAEDLTVTMQDLMIYTGQKLCPEVVIKDKKVMLTEGKDYTVNYQDNVETGTGKVILNFTGNYTGTRELSFTITDYQVNAPQASNITFGEKLSDSILSGEAPVEGTYSWQDGSLVPGLSDSGKTEYTVLFTPADPVYPVCKLGVTVQVLPAGTSVLYLKDGEIHLGSVEGEVTSLNGLTYRQQSGDSPASWVMDGFIFSSSSDSLPSVVFADDTMLTVNGMNYVASAAQSAIFVEGNLEIVVNDNSSLKLDGAVCAVQAGEDATVTLKNEGIFVFGQNDVSAEAVSATWNKGFTVGDNKDAAKILNITTIPFVVTVTSASGTNTGMALLSGGGVYGFGSTAELTAYAMEGFDFDGWYLNGEKKSGSMTLSLSVKSDLHYEARYSAQNVTCSLNIDFARFTLTVNGEVIDSKKAASGEYPVNSLVTISCEDTDLLYWINDDTDIMDESAEAYAYLFGSMCAGYFGDGTVVSTKRTFSFYLTKNTSIHAIYKSEEEDSLTLIVVGPSGKILSQVISDEDDSVELPEKMIVRIKGIEDMDMLKEWTFADSEGKIVSLTDEAVINEWKQGRKLIIAEPKWIRSN